MSRFAPKIEGEPVRPRTRLDVGTYAWFVGCWQRWFLVEIMHRRRSPRRVVLRSVTGQDADKEIPWPWGDDELELRDHTQESQIYLLRPLSAREVPPGVIPPKVARRRRRV